jgi:hypothetical protein
MKIPIHILLSIESAKSEGFKRFMGLKEKMKCSICGKTIAETFLKKIVGGYVKKEGKLHAVCRECQKQFQTKEKLIENIK